MKIELYVGKGIALKFSKKVSQGAVMDLHEVRVFGCRWYGSSENVAQSDDLVGLRRVFGLGSDASME